MMIKVAIGLMIICFILLLAAITGYVEQLQDKEIDEWKDEDDV